MALIESMDNRVKYTECESKETSRVAEAAGGRPEVIPFVSPEKVA
jgi:hypothetical protein